VRELSKVEPLWYVSSFDHRKLNIAGAVNDAVDNVATKLENPTEKAISTRLWYWVADVGGKVHFDNIDTLHIDVREYRDVGDRWYCDICSRHELLERKPRRFVYLSELQYNNYTKSIVERADQRAHYRGDRELPYTHNVTFPQSLVNIVSARQIWWNSFGLVVIVSILG
jgi:hypothetical protein